ncbi:MAG TPA: Gldg family protein, partial [Labilithrix sp.]
LDQDVQKALLKVLRDKRTAYFTSGHGELENVAATAQNDGRTGKAMREMLDQLNYATKDLNATNGLGVDVPEDATVVLVLGPQHAFLPEEVASLKRYVDRGGKLFLCLDPEAKIDDAPLADLVGLTVGTAVLANDKVHLRRRYNDSDRIILATNRFSSHASVSTLSRMASRPVVFLGAASLDKKQGADGSLKFDFAVRAMPDTFDDENGNFKIDPPGEKKNTYALVAAVSKTVNPNVEMRAFVIGDADAVSDAAFGNEGNVVLAADALHWLTGEESFAGAMSTPEDVRIEHTKQKDLVWFYGTIFGAPAIVLGTGLVYTRRVRKKKTPRKEASS